MRDKRLDKHYKYHGLHLREGAIAIGKRFFYYDCMPSDEDLACGPTLISGIPNAGKSTMLKVLKMTHTDVHDLDDYSSHNKHGRFVTHWRGLDIKEHTICGGISQTLLYSPKLTLFKNFVYLTRCDEDILKSDRKRKVKNFDKKDDYEAYQKIRRSKSIVFLDLLEALRRLP